MAWMPRVSDKELIFKMYKEFLQLHSKRTTNLILKWAKDLDRYCAKRQANDQQLHKKLFSTSNHQRKVNPKHSEIAPNTSEDFYYQNKSSNKGVGKAMNKREPFYSVGGNVNWYSHYGSQYGVSSKI